MLQSDSQAHHNRKENPSLRWKYLPYHHTIRQRGNSFRVFSDDTAEDDEKEDKYSDGNKHQPPQVIRVHQHVSSESFNGYVDTRDAPDSCRYDVSMRSSDHVYSAK